MLNSCLSLSCSRLLEPWPTLTTFLCQYPRPSHCYRRVWFLWNAQRFLPFPSGRLETRDPRDVWSAQSQRKGKQRKTILACVLLVFDRVLPFRDHILGHLRINFARALLQLLVSPWVNGSDDACWGRFVSKINICVFTCCSNVVVSIVSIIHYAELSLFNTSGNYFTAIVITEKPSNNC